VQDAISENVARALSLKLALGSTRRIDPLAFDSYARGQYFFDQFTWDGNRKAEQYFETAIERQPDYARAYAGLALNYGVMIERGFLSAAEGTPKLKGALDRAFALDDSLPDAYTAQTNLRMIEYDWRGAEQSVKRAIALNPSYLHALSWYSYMLGILGRFDEALSIKRRELELDPVSDYASKDLGEGLINLGRYTEAVQELQRTLELRPGFGPALSELARAYQQMNRLEDAYNTFVSAGDTFDAAYVRALQGDSVPARQLLTKYGEVAVLQYAAARLYFVVGDKERALTALEQACNTRAAGIVFLKTDPAFAPIRNDPRVRNLIARMRL
jgi:tetratricopeptide (TPR) repeat protein